LTFLQSVIYLDNRTVNFPVFNVKMVQFRVLVFSVSVFESVDGTLSVMTCRLHGSEEVQVQVKSARVEEWKSGRVKRRIEKMKK
jgi:hypothetical protein